MAFAPKGGRAFLWARGEAGSRSTYDPGMEGGVAVRRVGRTLLRTLYLLLAVFAAVVAIVQLPGALRAARDDGTPGTFTAVHKECTPNGLKSGGCSIYGDFVSQDGTIRLSNVLYDGVGGQVGDRHPAQYAGDTDPVVVYAPGSRTWIVIAGFGLVALGYLGYRGWRLVRPRRATSEPDE
jgi:hypothetical protein